MIAEQIDRLCEVLSALESRHRQLYQMAEEKQEAIVGSEIDELMDVVEREEQLMEEIDDLEARRRTVSQKLTHKIDGIEPGDFNLSALIEYMENMENESMLSGLRERLASQQESLQKLLRDLERLNEQNRELLLEAMKFNEFSLKVLLQGAEPESTYQPDGSGREDNGGQSSSIIDRRA